MAITTGCRTCHSDEAYTCNVSGSLGRDEQRAPAGGSQGAQGPLPPLLWGPAPHCPPAMRHRGPVPGPGLGLVTRPRQTPPASQHRGSGFSPKVGWAPSLGRRKTADGDCRCREYARFQRARVCWLSSVGRKSFLCPRSCVKTNKAVVHVVTCPATTWALAQGRWTGRPCIGESPEGGTSSAQA